MHRAAWAGEGMRAGPGLWHLAPQRQALSYGEGARGDSAPSSSPADGHQCFVWGWDGEGAGTAPQEALPIRGPLPGTARMPHPTDAGDPEPHLDSTLPPGGEEEPSVCGTH